MRDGKHERSKSPGYLTDFLSTKACEFNQRIQSREEILDDKVIAPAVREDQLKNRDRWDIARLFQQGITLPAP